MNNIEAVKGMIEDLPVSDTQFTLLSLIEIIDGLQKQIDTLEEKQAEQCRG